MLINWYPGHMRKTKRLLQENLKLVDIVFELLDSRIPISSTNPDIDDIIGNKPRVVVLNKSDLSNGDGNSKWINHFKRKGITAIPINAIGNKGVKKVIDEANVLMSEKFERLLKKGIKNRPIRAMIVGIPNVGKSTLINTLSGRKSARTGNRPGVTKGNQWIKLKGNLELLDTPGILWPKFEDQNVGRNLAFTGAIKDEIMDIEILAISLTERLLSISPHLLEERYKIEIGNLVPTEVIEEIGKKRGCIVKGGEIDISRTSHIILDEFRRGIIGRVTLEFPEDLIEGESNANN